MKQDFVIGQRWINDAELQLGLGTVLEVEHRTVTIFFQATNEQRSYARETAPLTRIVFFAGDTVHCHDGLEIVIDDVHESNGLLTYKGKDVQGVHHEIDEILLDTWIPLNRAADRLFTGQIDEHKWFALRYQSLLELNRIGLSPLRGFTGARVSLIPHQLYIAHEVANRYAPRVLLADEVGLGKTIEAGLILHQQTLTERAQRVLIVVPDSLVHQWFVEMLRRFNMHFSIFDEERYQAILENDADRNPFQNDQLVLCSLKFISHNESVRQHACAGEWDLLVVDEAHHLQWSPQQASIEYLAIEQLASTTAGVLLLTATPEQLGRAGHFARLRLLDPDRFPDFDSFIEEEQGYEPIANAIDKLFREQTIDRISLETLATNIEATDKERLFSLLQPGNEKNIKNELVEHLLDRHGTGRVLFRNTRSTISGFPKRTMHPCPLSLPDAYNRLSSDNNEEELWLRPERIYSNKTPWTSFDPRVDWLQKKLIELKPEKVLVIAASAETALELSEVLRVRFGIHVAVFHESLSIVERDRAAAYFADEDEGCQALLCSEIGSEGRNFQFAHHMILFDLPLNPDLLEQRIGRLDRIGQTQTINIHVPYMQDSAQAIQFRWLHEGLQAFERPCSAGAIVFKQMESQLLAALSAPHNNIDDLLAETRLILHGLEQELQKGRDRLLEYNSCRPAVAQALQQQALRDDKHSTLAQYMEIIFDCFGVQCEEHSANRYIITPGPHMLTTFPQLPDEGMTITYDRDIALANEDIHYLSWDHPMVTGAMDIVLTSELGNTSVIAIEYDGLEAGTMLLECIYIYESASSHSLQASRYMPPSIIRTLVNEQGEALGPELSQDLVSPNMLPVDRNTAKKVVQAILAKLKQMTEDSGMLAKKRAPEILATAHRHARNQLTGEIDRLRSLSKVNKNIREEEIVFFEQQLQALDRVLSAASLRLDALRVIVVT